MKAEHNGKPAQIARTRVAKLPRDREVYVMETDGACKIGISWRASQRLRSVRTNTPSPVRLVRAFPIIAAYVLDAEAEAHRQLAEHRIQGEWFKVSPARACAAVETAIALVQGFPAQDGPSPFPLRTGKM